MACGRRVRGEVDIQLSCECSPYGQKIKTVEKTVSCPFPVHSRHSLARWRAQSCVQSALAGAREKLPFFEPYDTRQLLADAERENNGKATDATLQALYIRRCRVQTAELLRALKCDPHDVQVWAHAFIKLASLHHNVGRLVHRRGGARANAKAWTPNDESLLLLGVAALVSLLCARQESRRRCLASRSAAGSTSRSNRPCPPARRCAGRR
jgi:hypothetical protein